MRMTTARRSERVRAAAWCSLGLALVPVALAVVLFTDGASATDIDTPSLYYAIGVLVLAAGVPALVLSLVALLLSHQGRRGAAGTTLAAALLGSVLAPLVLVVWGLGDAGRVLAGMVLLVGLLACVAAASGLRAASDPPGPLR